LDDAPDLGSHFVPARQAPQDFSSGILFHIAVEIEGETHAVLVSSLLEQRRNDI
jgi:hypothetical protein